MINENNLTQGGPAAFSEALARTLLPRGRDEPRPGPWENPGAHILSPGSMATQKLQRVCAACCRVKAGLRNSKAWRLSAPWNLHCYFYKIGV